MSIITKAIDSKELTELSLEWIIHEQLNKKLTLIINMIAGRAHLKYGVIENGFCVLITKSQKKAIKKYNSVMLPRKNIFPSKVK